MKPANLQFFIDPSRCIGCQSCVQACTECDTHRGDSMIHVEYVDRALSTQTRRIGPLVKQYPEPRIELHPRLAEKLGIANGEWATAETRRGSVTLQAQVVTTIRPDTIFIPYHWAGPKSANQLTIAAQDPTSKIPEYKVCAVRLRRADGPPAYAKVLEPQQ